MVTLYEKKEKKLYASWLRSKCFYTMALLHLKKKEVELEVENHLPIDQKYLDLIDEIGKREEE